MSSSRPIYRSNPIPRNCDRGRKLFDAISGAHVYEDDTVVDDDGYRVDGRSDRTWNRRYDLEGDHPFVPDAQGSGIVFPVGR